MDILKILSRGTKKSSSHSIVPPPVAKPSNPQLYHDPARGVKRKRHEVTQLADATEDDGAEEVDFFAPKTAKKASDNRIAEEHVADSKTVSATTPQLLDEDEVRQVLRSHRLKFTVLGKSQGRVQKARKSKSKDQEKSKSKDVKQQLHPQPLTSFIQLKSTYNISPRLLGNLAKQGYRMPTEVQLGSLPLLLRPDLALQQSSEDHPQLQVQGGVHFLAVAPTGSGKTLSFLIPTINAIMRRRSEEEDHDGHALEAVVVAPTRELAHQIVNEGRKLAAGTGLKIVGFKKGMRIPTEDQDPEEDSSHDELSASEDEEASSSAGSEDEAQSDAESATRALTKADILVTTPLMLLNFLSRGSKTKKTLPQVRSLVLDEADVLLDPLFREQTLGIWSSCSHGDLRVTCWSATMGSNIEDLVLEQLATRQASGDTAPLIRLVVGLKDTAVPSVNHRLIYTGDGEKGKLYTLRQLLHPNTASDGLPQMRLPFLVFVQTIERAASLHEELKFEFPAEAGGPSRIATLHSSLSESARAGIVARFRAGEIWVLITTDLLMRGIDFRGVNGVINFDIPTSAAAYVHRVGRTGRAGHEGGVAVTFYTKEDVPFLKNIANVISLSEKQAGKDADVSVPKWLMDALPKVRKEDKKKLKERGVESRRGDKAQISSKSAWEKRRENNRRAAIAGSKKRKIEKPDQDEQASDWSGIDD